MLAETFRQNLRAAINERGLSVSAVSRRAGYNNDYARKVLSGRKTNPTLQFVEAMAGAVGVVPTDLLNDNGERHDRD